MSEAIRVVYVDAGTVGAVMEGASTDARLALIRAETGIDALKRLHSESIDALVLPQAVPDLDVDELVSKAARTAPDTAVVVVGYEGDLPEDAIRLPADASEAAVVDRIRGAVGDRLVDSALTRYERLEAATLRIAQAVIAADDRDAIDRAVHDRLVESDAYRFVWVGRYRPESDEIEVSYPFPGRFSPESVAASVGADRRAFLTEAIESGTVTVQRSRDSTRSASAEAVQVSTPDGITFAAVPLTHDGTNQGVVILGTGAPGAFDAAERTLLDRLGSIVGHALAAASRAPSQGRSDPERVKQIVDVLAHELRNPLQIASSYLDIGRTHGEEAALDRVAAAHETIEEIIASAVSLVEAGGVDELVPVDVGEAVAAIWGGLETGEAELVVLDPPTVLADPDLLDRILSNLLRNAISHAGPDVTVRVGALADGPGFFVEDDGPGVPPEDRASIFEWGFSTSNDGLGIGLGFVHDVVAAHGWHIEVATGAEGGARFEIHTATDTREPGTGSDAAADEADGAESELTELFDDWEPPKRRPSFEFS